MKQISFKLARRVKCFRSLCIFGDRLNSSVKNSLFVLPSLSHVFSSFWGLQGFFLNTASLFKDCSLVFVYFYLSFTLTLWISRLTSLKISRAHCYTFFWKHSACRSFPCQDYYLPSSFWPSIGPSWFLLWGSNDLRRNCFKVLTLLTFLSGISFTFNELSEHDCNPCCLIIWPLLQVKYAHVGRWENTTNHWWDSFFTLLIFWLLEIFPRMNVDCKEELMVLGQ